MPKVSLSKSIEAKKLNPKTGVTLSGPAVTIPYGAIIDNIEQERDSARFRYENNSYGCPYELLMSALDGSAVADDTAASAGTSASADRPRLQWIQVPASGPVTLRAKVPNGWLVSVGSGVTFYPDPEHQWDGTSI